MRTFDFQYANSLITKEIEGIAPENHPAELYEPVRYMMSLGGKRLRPLLVLLGHYLFSDEYEDALPCATAVELFHNFTLVHDDIMDNSPIRRGKETVYKKWNTNIAILSGDVMLVKVYEILLKTKPAVLSEVIARFCRCAEEVCQGQQLDMNFENEKQVSVEQYIGMIRLKTAVLLGNSLALGASIAQTSKENIEKIKLLGDNAGIGFQIKDDLLDVFGDSQKVGKQWGGDILSNKKTFLLIKALETADTAQRKSLDYWLQAVDYKPEEKVKAVSDIYNELSIQQITEKKMNEYFEAAFSLLNSLEASEEKKAFLAQFLRALIEREN